MFVSKKRYEAMMADQNALVLQLRAMLNNKIYDNADKMVEIKKLTLALEFISDQRTAAANATVTRMADRADEALGRTKMAEFITEEPQPEGTLADLRRTFFPNVGSTVTGTVNIPIR